MTESRSQARREFVLNTSWFCFGCGKEFLEEDEKKLVRESVRGWPEIWMHVEKGSMCFSSIHISNYDR